MEKDTNIINRVSSVISSAALSLSLLTRNSTCFFTAYQPVEPKELSKFSKK